MVALHFGQGVEMLVLRAEVMAAGNVAANHERRVSLRANNLD